MEWVGILPESEGTFPGNKIPLFGLLSKSNKEQEDCHFCLESIKKEQIFTMETPCCKHVAHCECFATWITSSRTIQAVKCAYCRTVFPNVCFMCLKPKNSEEKIVKTYCCHSTLHNQCIKDLQYIVSQLSFDLWIECGVCWCLWKKNSVNRNS